MGGAPSPRIAQETLRRTPRICTRACRRVQVAQRLRSRASGANGLFCAYKAEAGGSSPSTPTHEMAAQRPLLGVPVARRGVLGAGVPSVCPN